MFKGLCSVLFVFFGIVQCSLASSDIPVDRDLEITAVRACRSCVIYFHNNSSADLQLSKCELLDGEWNRKPADRINPGRWVAWASGSDSWSGTKGSAVYTSGGRKVSIFWDNPYVGSNRIYSDPEIPQSGLKGIDPVVRFYFR